MEQKSHIVDMKLTNLQQLCNAIMSTWTQILEKYPQRLVESMHEQLGSSEGKRCSNLFVARCLIKIVVVYN